MNPVIGRFLKTASEPVPDALYGDGFRCTVSLKDGTVLPCVMLRNVAPLRALALRRLDEERGADALVNQAKYERLVSHFVASGNRVNARDIGAVTESRFAIPLSLRSQIRGETTMGWTGFVLEMSDGRLFGFGTSFLTEFFDLPETHEFSDVRTVHNHAFVRADGSLGHLQRGFSTVPADYDMRTVFRERPYFICSHDV